MNFEFSPEERAFEAEVEAFLRAEHSSDVMDAHPEQLSQTVDTPSKRAFMRKLAERGWLGMSWPKQYGGQEKAGIYDFLLTEALSRSGAPQPGKGVGIVGKTIIRHGNEQLKQFAFLPRIMRGVVEFAIGYSRTGAPVPTRRTSSCAARATTRAAGGVLGGQKILDHLGAFADWYWVGRAHRARRARSTRASRCSSSRWTHPGLSVRATWTIGDEHTDEVFFDDVFVSDAFVVGEVNHGLGPTSCEALDLERLAMRGGPLGEVEALLRMVARPRGDGAPAAQRMRRRAAGDRAARDEFEVARMLAAPRDLPKHVEGRCADTASRRSTSSS